MHPIARYFKLSAIALLVLGLFVARPSVGLGQGTGIPILVVVNDSYGVNPFGRYLGEILRAEGLNAYEVIELGSLTAADLAAHDLTILAETSLTSAQANLLTTYVNNGGRLLAMRPDPQIKGLFGLGDAAGTVTDGYLKIHTAAVWNGAVPGQGLTGETLQIHGTADCYTPTGGAVVLAQLYSNATTATPYPAVIGASSGRAVAFTYDLARNVVYTRQGNPANADLDVDGDEVVRTIDLFQDSGGGAPWVDRDKIPIPQADEQQRLLARLVQQMVGEVRPLPQMWYFPGTAKTVLILTADAHGNPTSAYQNEINSLNARGARATFYLSIAQDPPESQPGSNNDVLDWVAQGHTFGIHPYWYHPDPYPPYDTRNLTEGYNAWDMWFGLQYPHTPKSPTVRNHQVAWEGWTDAAEIAEAHGYRLDTNFYHWGAWLQKADNSWPHGYITGSGQPMKFVRADGHIINLYQQLTQLVDEQLIRPPDWAFENLNAAAAVAVSQQLIDASIEGDYAALMTQFHVDHYSGQTQTWAEGTVEYANSLGVPVWNADRWLSFTETRHDANYNNITWTGATRTLNFDLSAAATSGVSLTTMLPLSYQGNPLESVRVDDSPVSYSTQTIKGVNVAFVTVPAGNHSFEVKYQNSQLPGLSINDVTVTEGNSGTTPAVFTVTLSTVTTQTVSVNYATADGSAVAPGDYSSTSGTLTFTPGQTSR
ncbi:MAG: hypothetical protein NUW24_03010, partial [Anaerolineae bacterium]|nr:hypothetical protein [Anaerolineae bacterium]